MSRLHEQFTVSPPQKAGSMRRSSSLSAVCLTATPSKATAKERTLPQQPQSCPRSRAPRNRGAAVKVLAATRPSSASASLEASAHLSAHLADTAQYSRTVAGLVRTVNNKTIDDEFNLCLRQFTLQHKVWQRVNDVLTDFRVNSKSVVGVSVTGEGHLHDPKDCHTCTNPAAAAAALCSTDDDSVMDTDTGFNSDCGSDGYSDDEGDEDDRVDVLETVFEDDGADCESDRDVVAMGSGSKDAAICLDEEAASSAV